MPDTALVVDDEPDVVDLLRFNLKKAGMDTLEASTGVAGLAIAQSRRPDVIILDVMLPGKDGFQVCEELKGHSETANIPVLMLTAKGQTNDRITGLELGADDYLTKPFSPREIVLRVQGLLRRSKGQGELSTISVDELVLDRANFSFALRGKKLELTGTEFKLLAALVERRGKILGREKLLHDVWGYRSAIDTRTVDTHVRRLREKLGDYAHRIETVRGEGYRFIVSHP